MSVTLKRQILRNGVFAPIANFLILYLCDQMGDTFIISNINYFIEFNLYFEILKVYTTTGVKKRVCSVAKIHFICL